MVCAFSGNKTFEITPGYYKYQTDYRYNVYKIPDFDGDWQIATPSAHIAYVNGVNNRLDKKVKHVIRLIKDIKYAHNIPISSFYLEMRTAKHCDDETFISYAEDVHNTLNRLVNDELALMQDPVGIAGYIEPCSTDAKKTEALSNLTSVRNRAKWAIEEEKAGNHTKALEWCFIEVDSKEGGVKTLREGLSELVARQQEINGTAYIPSPKARERAEKNIKNGRQNYEVDE